MKRGVVPGIQVRKYMNRRVIETASIKEAKKKESPPQQRKRELLRHQFCLCTDSPLPAPCLLHFALQKFFRKTPSRGEGGGRVADLGALLAHVLEREIEMWEKSEDGEEEAVRRGVDEGVTGNRRELRKEKHSYLASFFRHE